MEASIPAIIAAALSIIEDIAPLISNNATIAKIVSTLETWLPVIEQGATDLYQPVKNIIAALQSNGAVTADQITALQTLDQATDAANDAALAAYNAANPDPATGGN